MKLIDNELYVQDLKAFGKEICGDNFNNCKLNESSIMISGATGMIGSFIIDAIMLMNKNGLRCHVIALGRNEEKACDRFGDYFNSSLFTFVTCDVGKNEPNIDIPVDYIIHAASTTHPKAYATEPVGTLMINILGLNNLLNYAKNHNNKRFAFVSSVEVYGENKGDVNAFDEDYLGYINCNTLRAGYPESKRAGEALCQAYIKECDMDIVIPRLARTYGPTMLMSDSKAISQFIKKGVAGEDIVLKSEGNQLYSYTYVLDAAVGLMKVLLEGKCGEAYNVSDSRSDITLTKLAQTIAKISATNVVFEIPDEIESAGYSTATKAILDSNKIRDELNFRAFYTIDNGLLKTIKIIKSI